MKKLSLLMVVMIFGSSVVSAHWMETGEYDVMLVWTMEGGPSDLEWDRSPKWY